MDVVIPRCCGIDVHQKTLTACIRIQGPTGAVTREVRTFATMVRDLQALRVWLHDAGVTHAAIESTGVLWKPVWHVLEGHIELLLVNPRDVKRVPGRKTDVQDAEWLAQLLQCGRFRGRCLPA